jgi:hypothetical protein
MLALAVFDDERERRIERIDRQLTACSAPILIAEKKFQAVLP